MRGLPSILLPFRNEFNKFLIIEPRHDIPIMSFGKSLEYSMSVKLLTEHRLEFLSLKGGCTGSSESTLVKMPHHVATHMIFILLLNLFSGVKRFRICNTKRCYGRFFYNVTRNSVNHYSNALANASRRLIG